jgi:epoxyqueuosine reductase
MTGPQKEYTLWLKESAFQQGAVLFGVTDVEPLKKNFTLLESEARGMNFGISLAVSLSTSVLTGIQDGPSLLYKWHYQQANNLLDKIAFVLTQKIGEKGHKALPIPASQIVDWEKHRGHLSHRLIAESAGLGWRGRNNLLVNEQYGSAIRLVTILTDIPLETDSPVEAQCGLCNVCVQSCPAGALGMTPQDYQITKCYEKLTAFSRRRGIGVHICGVCVKSCMHRKNHQHAS